VRILRWTAAIVVGTALAAVPSAIAAVVLALALPSVRRAPTSPTDAVVSACAAAAILLLLWLALSVLAATADELRARRSRRRIPATRGVPIVVRRLVATVVGLLLGSATLAANAAERAVPEVGWAVSAPVQAGWPSHPTAHPTTHLVPEQASEHVVVRGESLWSLAESRCGPQASPAEVLAESQRLYAVNADVIGDDPDLLLPGQILHLP